MRIADIFPPVGWLLSTAVAALAGLVFQGPVLPPAEEASWGMAAAENPLAPVGLSLPEPASREMALAAFSERPLLAEGRRPFRPAPPETEAMAEPVVAPTPVPAAEAATEPPALIMMGSIEKGDGWQVLLRDEASGQEDWTEIGETRAGWTIVAIQPESVVLQLQGAEITLHLFDKTLP